jgi:hypothetical protein
MANLMEKCNQKMEIFRYLAAEPMLASFSNLPMPRRPGGSLSESGSGWQLKSWCGLDRLRLQLLAAAKATARKWASSHLAVPGAAVRARHLVQRPGVP